MVRTITNITNKRLKAILPNDFQSSLIKAIDQIPLTIKPRIKEVAMDMNGNCRTVVADRFHLIQDANQRISQERIIAQDRVGRGFKIPKKLMEKNQENLTNKEQLQLQEYFKSFPELRCIGYIVFGN